MQAARAHVEVCARCKEEVRQAELALAAYAQAAPAESTPEADLPSGAKQRFMARVAQEADAPAAKPIEKPAAATPAKPDPAKPPSAEPEGWFGALRWSTAFAVGFALLLVAVAYDDLHQRAELGPLMIEAQRGRIDSAQLNQLMELLTSAQAQRVALHETPSKTPPPEGRVVYSARNGKLLLTAQNLHPLPAGKVYELWILQPNGGKPLPAGTFAPDSSGNAAMILAEEPANLAVAGFGVTVENEGGAQTPTPPIVLSGR
jgi:hypothetical protein